MMMANREQKQVTKKDDISEGNSQPNPIGRPRKTGKIHGPIETHGRGPSLKEQRQLIITEKPVIPKVQDYFRELVKQLEHADDSD